MERHLRVTVDVRRLRSNLSAAERRPMSTLEIRQFLLDAGFEPDGDGWSVREADLGQLQPDEVLDLAVIAPGRLAVQARRFRS